MGISKEKREKQDAERRFRIATLSFYHYGGSRDEMVEIIDEMDTDEEDVK